MSVPAVKWAMSQKVGDATAKFVLVNLAWHHNPESGLCCPSIPTIQEECDFKSTRTVQQAIKRLAEQGLLSLQREYKNGTISRTVYTLIGLEGGGALNEGDAPDAGDALNAGGASDASTPCIKCTTPPALNAPTPLHEMHPIEKEEKVEREETLRGDIAATVDDFGLEPDVQEEKPKKKAGKKAALDFYGLPESLIADWKVNRKKHPLTQTAIDGFKREAEKAHKTLEEAVRISVERGWQGFKAEWLENAKEPENIFRVRPEPENIFRARPAQTPVRKREPEFDAGADALMGRLL